MPFSSMLRMGGLMASNLNLPWNREVHVQLGTFVVWRGSWPTYDIELEPPIDWGGSVPSSNSHRIEKVPGAHLTSILDLPWNRRIHIQLWTFKELRSSGTTFDVYIRPPMNLKDSYPTLNLQKIEKFRNHILRRNWTSYGIEGFISDFESSWIGEVPDQLRTFV